MSEIATCPNCRTNTMLEVCPNCEAIVTGDNKGKDFYEVEAAKKEKPKEK